MRQLLLAGTAVLALGTSHPVAEAAPIVFDFTYTGNLVTFIVPSTDAYQIVAFGAQGGSVPSVTGPGGQGAEIGGNFSLTAGQILQIAVGGAGGDGSANLIGVGLAAGGGGGSFVVGSDNTPLVIAGGGGGGGKAPPPGAGGMPLSGGGGLTGPDGGGLFGGTGGSGAGNGGINGDCNPITGGLGPRAGGGGGGGFFSNGAPGCNGGAGGGAFPDLAGGSPNGGLAVGEALPTVAGLAPVVGAATAVAVAASPDKGASRRVAAADHSTPAQTRFWCLISSSATARS